MMARVVLVYWWNKLSVNWGCRCPGRRENSRGTQELAWHPEEEPRKASAGATEAGLWGPPPPPRLPHQATRFSICTDWLAQTRSSPLLVLLECRHAHDLPVLLCRSSRVECCDEDRVTHRESELFTIWHFTENVYWALLHIMLFLSLLVSVDITEWSALGIFIKMKYKSSLSKSSLYL